MDKQVEQRIKDAGLDVHTVKVIQEAMREQFASDGVQRTPDLLKPTLTLGFRLAMYGLSNAIFGKNDTSSALHRFENYIQHKPND